MVRLEQHIALTPGGAADPSRATGTFVLTQRGDLTDDETVNTLLRESREGLGRAKTRFVLDLRGATAADTKIIAALIELQRLALGSGIKFGLQISTPIRKWLSICHLDWLER